MERARGANGVDVGGWLRHHLRAGTLVSSVVFGLFYTAPAVLLAFFALTRLDTSSLPPGVADELRADAAYLAGTFLAALIVLFVTRRRFERMRRAANVGRELEEILHHLPVLVARIDNAGIITSLRGAALEAIGVRASDRIGQSLLGRPQVPEITVAARQALAGEEQRIEIELRGRSVDIAIAPDHVTGGAIAVGLDRTEQRLAERRAAEERRSADRRTLYEELLDHVSDGFIALRSDGVCAYVNRRTLELTGTTHEDFLGRSLADLTMVPIGLVRSAMRECVAQIREDRDDRASLEWRAYPSAEGVAIFITDTSDRRRLETERERVARAAILSAVVTHTNEGLIVTSDRVVTSWNAGAERILGYTADEMVGRHTDVLSVDREDPRLKSQIAQVMSGHALRDEARWRHKTGHAVTVSVGYTPQAEPDGTVHEVIAFFHDISDIERRREELQREERRLAAKRDEALVLLAHEVRSPVAAMSMLADGISRAPTLSQRDRQATVSLRAQAEALATLAEDLLAVGQLESGARHFERQMVDLRGVVTAAVVRAEAARIDVDLPRAPLVASVDPTDLGRALDNLVSNALKYSPRSSRVSVTARSQGDDAVIEVSDRGVGFTVEERDRLFQKFERLAGGRRLGGIGLGLYLARLLVEAQGGTIAGESRGKAKGATFRMTIPLAA